MNKILKILVVFCFLSVVFPGGGQTTKKISEYPVSTTASSLDDFLVNIWGGATYTTKRISFTNLYNTAIGPVVTNAITAIGGSTNASLLTGGTLADARLTDNVLLRSNLVASGLELQRYQEGGEGGLVFIGEGGKTNLYIPYEEGGAVRFPNGIVLGDSTVVTVPQLKVSSTTIKARLGDDSADAPISASAATFSGALTTTGITNHHSGDLGVAGTIYTGDVSGTNAIFDNIYGNFSVVTNAAGKTPLFNETAGNGAELTNLNASALGTGTVPLARLPGLVITNESAVESAYSIGKNSGATASGAVTYGEESQATGVDATAIGKQTYATEWDATAIGAGSVAGHQSSTAVGPLSQTTEANQIRLGTASHTVSVPGKLIVSGGGTNTMDATVFTNGIYGDASRLTNILATQLPGVVTPESRGAIGDGVTDDTAAVQAAIDLAGTYSNLPVLLTRTYKITSPLVVTQSVVILGTRKSYQAAQLNGSTLSSGEAVLQLDQFAQDGFTMRDVTIKGPARGTASSACLRILGTSASDMGHIEITGCTFEAADRGVWANGIATASFNDCFFENNLVGVTLTNGLNAPYYALSDGVVFNNCFAKLQPKIAFEFRNANAVTLLSSGSNGTNCVVASGGSFVTVIGGKYEQWFGTNLDQCAFHFDNSTATMIGVAMISSGRSIVVTNGARLTMSGCSVPVADAVGEEILARGETLNYMCDLTALEGGTSFRSYWLSNSTANVTNTVYNPTLPYAVVAGSGVTVSTNNARVFTLTATGMPLASGTNTTVVTDGVNNYVNVGGAGNLVTNVYATNHFSPAAWWSMDEAASPWAEPVNTNTLTLVGSGVAQVTGKQSYAITNGVGSEGTYLTAADSDSLSYSGPFTIIAWVYQSATGANPTYYLWKTNEYWLRYTGAAVNRVDFGLGATSADFVRATNASAYAGSWRFLAATYNGTTATIQVDNSTTYSRALTAPSDGTSGLTLSWPQAGSSYSTMDEVAIFKRVLTADELTYFYNTGSGRALVSGNVTNTTPTPLYWGQFTGDSSGLTNIPSSSIVGGKSGTTSITVVTNGSDTITFWFTNGVLGTLTAP